VGERGGTGHIIMEYNPDRQRLGFYRQDNQEIELDEQHFEPLFIAKDVEELRRNPEARKALRQYNIFTGRPAQ